MSTGNDTEIVTKDRMEPGGQTSFSVIPGFTQAIQEMPERGKHKHLAGNFYFSLSD